jgi:hypothetical protein
MATLVEQLIQVNEAVGDSWHQSPTRGASHARIHPGTSHRCRY